MRRLARPIALSVAIYCTVWLLTFLAAAPTLKRQVYRELLPAWREDQAGQAEARKTRPFMPELKIYREGPVATVKLLFCPAPFLFRAECGRHISGSNGYGTVGYYLLTPWHVYAIAETHTWIA